MTKKQSILNYAQGAPMQKEPDYSKLTDNEVRTLYEILLKLERDNLPLESLPPDELTEYQQIIEKL